MTRRKPPSGPYSRERKTTPRRSGGLKPRRSDGQRCGKRPKKSRSDELWLYGVHAVIAALANPARRHNRLILAAGLEEALEEQVMKAAEAGGFNPKSAEFRDRHEIDGLLPAGAVHQGLALQTDPLAGPHLEDLLAEIKKPTRLVVLDQATDPRNIGAVLRAAAAFGARAVIVQDRRSPAESGALAKAASGALETVHMVRVTNIARGMERLKEAGFYCLGLDAAAARPLADAAPDGPCALILGSEGGGLRRLTRENCDLLVHIPIAGAVESLNLSTAAAIALYELARKRA